MQRDETGEEEGHFTPALNLSLGPSTPFPNLYPSPSLSKSTQGKIQVSKGDYEGRRDNMGYFQRA